MNKSLIFLTFVFVCITTSCQFRDRPHTNKDKSETVNVKITPGYFSQIMMDTPYEVNFVQGDEATVRIEGKKNDIERVLVSCQNEVLVIKNKSFGNRLFLDNDSDVKIFVCSPDLTGLTLRGSGDFNASGDIDTDTLNIRLLGSGDIDFDDVVCDLCRTQLNGSGDISIENVRTMAAQLDLMGAGGIELGLQNVRNTDVNLFGVGNIDIDFDNCLYAKCGLWGVGDITLSGTLKHLKQEKRGTGSISVKGLKN